MDDLINMISYGVARALVNNGVRVNPGLGDAVDMEIRRALEEYNALNGMPQKQIGVSTDENILRLPLQIREGRHYIRRDGRVVGPVRVNRNARWPFFVKVEDEGAVHTYRQDGTTDPYGVKSKFDLIGVFWCKKHD